MATKTQAAPGIRERVAAGAKWLDQRDPNWWREDQPGHGADGGPIDLDELSMRHPCYCVLGQRWGNYYHAPISLDDAVAFGFDTAAVMAPPRAEFEAAADAEFEALTAEWVRVITERRERAAACCPCAGVICDPGCPCPECPKSEAEITDD